MGFWEATLSNLLVAMVCLIAKIIFSKLSRSWKALLTDPIPHKRMSLFFLIIAIFVYACGNAVVISEFFSPIIDIFAGCITGFIAGAFLAIADFYHKMYAISKEASEKATDENGKTKNDKLD